MIPLNSTCETGLAELLKDCVVDAIPFDASTAIGQQHLGAAMRLDGLTENIDLSLTEVGGGRNAVNEIVHVLFSYMVFRVDRKTFILQIVAVRAGLSDRSIAQVFPGTCLPAP